MNFLGVDLSIIFSIFAAFISLSTLIYNRFFQYRNRYWDRWAQLGKMVIEKNLMRMWVGKVQYDLEFKGNNIDLSHEERVFAELYLDFFVEVNSISKITRLFTGSFPGKVGISNPMIQKVYTEYLKKEYVQKHQDIVDKHINKK